MRGQFISNWTLIVDRLTFYGRNLMDVTLSLTAEDAAKLERQALAVGTDVKTYILNLLRDSRDSDVSSASNLPYQEWKRNFESWVARHESRNPDVDDSRESIYD